MTAVEVAPGPYRLRVAATDRGGRQGTVDYEFIAQLSESGPYRISNLMLGENAPNAGFRPLFDFKARNEVAVQAEIYGKPPAAGTLIAALDGSATLSGPPLAKGVVTIQEIPKSDKAVIRGTIPLAALPAGDYLVRLTVSLNGRVLGQLERTLHRSGS